MNILDVSRWYFADYPYIEEGGAEEWGRLAAMKYVDFGVSEAGLEAWVEAVAAHASQINTFWSSIEVMKSTIRKYHARVGGVRLFMG